MKYKHYSQFPLAKWRWPSFSPREMASKGEGELMIDEDSMDKLQALRDVLGRPLIINSAYRSEAHNKRVGGAKGSQHMTAKAFDVSMTNHNPAEFIAAARSVGFTGIGTYPSSNFVHVDTGPSRVWGDPFPRTTTRLPSEPVPDKSDVRAAGGVAGAGALAIAIENLPVAGGILGQLAPVAQTIAIVAAVAALAYIIWRGRK